MIPLFPNFKKLDLLDQTIIENYSNKYLPYSDYNFVSMYCYNIHNLVEISILNENLVVKFEDYINTQSFFSFLGNNEVIDTVEKLLKLSRENNYPALKLIPDENIASIRNYTNRFSIEEDKDNNDYILPVNPLMEFAGGKYYDKRNLVNRFKKIWKNYTISMLDLHEPEIQEQILNLFNVWISNKNKVQNESNHEFNALKRLFDGIKNFKTSAIGVFIDNNLVAFSIFDIVHKGYVIIHFEKYDLNYDGLSSLLRSESSKIFHKLNCNYINFEQDLGIPGLKKAKQLWRPDFFLKKYIIF